MYRTFLTPPESKSPVFLRFVKLPPRAAAANTAVGLLPTSRSKGPASCSGSVADLSAGSCSPWAGALQGWGFFWNSPYHLLWIFWPFLLCPNILIPGHRQQQWGCVQVAGLSFSCLILGRMRPLKTAHGFSKGVPTKDYLTFTFQSLRSFSMELYSAKWKTHPVH